MPSFAHAKRYAFNLLQLDSKPGTPLSLLNWVVILMICASLLLMGLETEHAVAPAFQNWITEVQFGILVIFAIEFLFRVWAFGYQERFRGLSGRGKLLRDPLLWADFMAFAPELFVLLFFPGWNTVIGIIRTARFLRLFKLMRFFRAGDMVLSAIANAAQQLLASFFISLSIIYMAAYWLYLAEGSVQPQIFGSVVRSLWWSVITLTAVGYGDAYPITPVGKFLASIIALVGVAMVALPAGILAGSFFNELKEARRARKLEQQKLEQEKTN